MKLLKKKQHQTGQEPAGNLAIIQQSHKTQPHHLMLKNDCLFYGSLPEQFIRISFSSLFSFRSFASWERISSLSFSKRSLSSEYLFTSASVLFLPSFVSTGAVNLVYTLLVKESFPVTKTTNTNTNVEYNWKKSNSRSTFIYWATWSAQTQKTWPDYKSLL